MTFPKSRFWFVIVAIALSSQAAMAQTKSSELPALALEVHFYPEQPPAFQPIARASRAGAWYARFGRVTGFVQPPETPAVTAVNIKAEMAEDGVRVWVSVFLGELHEQEKDVASYILHEREKTTVNELEKFGVEPFQIALVRMASSVAAAPQFISKAPSIELVTMTPNLSTLPSYNVVVRNVSTKSVRALQVRVLQEGRLRNGTMPQGQEGMPLTLPAGTYEFTTRIATRAIPAPDGYRPEVLPDQFVEISTAVFDDGSFEGDSEGAVAFLASQQGRKIQLTRVVELLQKSLKTESSTVDSLRVAIAALDFEADSPAVQDLLNRFPDAANIDRQQLSMGIQIGMKALRDNVLEDISQFQLRNRRRGPGAFHDWLVASRDRYQEWLGRL